MTRIENIKKINASNHILQNALTGVASESPEQQYRAGGGSKRVGGTATKQKYCYSCACFSLATMLPQKLQKTIPNFLVARMAAINLFHADLDKPLNYLLYRYEKAPPPPSQIVMRRSPESLSGIKFLPIQIESQCLICEVTGVLLLRWFVK